MLFPAAALKGENIYSVQGRVKYEVLERKIVWKETFTISVSNCLWAISVIRDDESKDVIFKQVYDGETVTMSSLFLQVHSQPTKGKLANDAALSVEFNDTPNSTAPLGMGPIWLAYASSCKFSGAASGLVEPAWLLAEELRRSRFKTPATWDLLPGAPFLPRNINFFYDESAFRQAMKGATPDPNAETAGAKSLWASFQVESVTNIDSLIFPKHFVLQVYNPGPTNAAKALALAYRYTGDVEAVMPGEMRDNLAPGFGNRTIVQDTRLGNWSNPITPVTYLVTNRVIPGTNDPKLLKLYAKWNLGHLPGSPKSPSTNPLVLFLALVAVVTVPLFFLLRQERNKQVKTNTK
jgi:hypothetical protein